MKPLAFRFHRNVRFHWAFVCQNHQPPSAAPQEDVGNGGCGAVLCELPARDPPKARLLRTLRNRFLLAAAVIERHRAKGR